jgi:predicted amidohydrolase
MADQLRVACVQMRVGPEKQENVERAEALVADAAALRADIVILPERWNAYGSPETLRAAAEDLSGGATIDAMSRWATTHSLLLVGGSITESVSAERLANTCLVFAPDGSVAATYRKIHMFDVNVGGLAYSESALDDAGDHVVALRWKGWSIGLSICYDLRFPELFRLLALRGVELVAVPAAWTMFTGKDHWEILLRTRAVENQCYVAAAGQHGSDHLGRVTYGRSLIADPWGLVLATAPDEDSVTIATIGRGRLERIRRDLPALANRKPGSYRWHEGVAANDETVAGLPADLLRGELTVRTSGSSG